MLRIIVSFLLLASFFAHPAQAQEGNSNTGMNTMTAQDSELTGAQPPAEMDRKWDMQQPVPKKDIKTGPQQDEEMSLPPANMRHIGRTGPAQPDFGINTHFATPENEETKEAPKGVQGPAATAKGNFNDLRQMDTTVVDQAIDPLRVRLKDGRIVQLSGIDVPDFDPYEPGDLSVAARDLLDSLVKGKQVRLYQTRNQKEGRTNRLGYPLVQMSLTGEDAVWIQGTLLAAGLARVRPSERNPEMAAQMIAIEDKARTDKKGMWMDLRYAALTPETAATGLNGWALIEGRIVSVATVENVIYLNFGPDWHTDFTIALNADVRRKLSKGGIDPMKLGGTNVRARGWLRDYNGPFMDLLHPVWMEILTTDKAETKTEATKGDSQ